MTTITVNGLAKSFRGRHQVTAIDKISFQVASGEVLTLVGASGCGKTTTLRCIAGLESPDAGLIRLGGSVVVDTAKGVRVPSHRRDIGLVFQSYALWPHLTARRNIEYPLRARRVGKLERQRRVGDIAKVVEFDSQLLDKHPSQLSGGQQQRVALARALVPETGVVLFDEPLSNLDARMRDQLRSEIMSIHQRIGFTGVYVTHDLTEAMVVGDRVAVMEAGAITQLGGPADVYERPATPGVAALVGMRRVNLRSDAETWPEFRARAGLQSGAHSSSEEFELWAHPDRVEILECHGERRRGFARFEGGSIDRTSYLGGNSEVLVRFGDRLVKSVVQGKARRLEIGTSVAVEIAHADLVTFERSQS